MNHHSYAIGGGSVIGRDHRVVPRNCQDAWHVLHTPHCAVAVVSDGCGSGQYSEVGAGLGVRLVAQAVAQEARRHGGIRWRRVQRDVISALAVLARSLGDPEAVVREHFLFTIVGVVLAHDAACFFALGDGLVVINGQSYPLGPFPGNAPPYLGHHLLDEPVRRDGDLKILAQLPLDQLDSFLIGTDGVLDLVQAGDRLQPGGRQPVGGLDQFWTQRQYTANPAAISRQLKLIARDYPHVSPAGRLVVDPGLLPDDTTLVVGRRQPS